VDYGLSITESEIVDVEALMQIHNAIAEKEDADDATTGNTNTQSSQDHKQAHKTQGFMWFILRPTSTEKEGGLSLLLVEGDTTSGDFLMSLHHTSPRETIISIYRHTRVVRECL